MAAFGGAAALGHRWVTTSARFAIRAIEVRGAHALSPDAVASLLPVRIGDNMFASDTVSLERVLRGNPWIEDADVHRELPGVLIATITERAPLALVDLGAPYLVDASGAPFKRAALERGEAQGLPVISGVERLAFRADPVSSTGLIRAGLEIIARWQASSRPTIAQLIFDDFGGVTLRTQEPALTIALGALDDPSLTNRMHRFEEAWARLSEEERARTESIYLDAGSSQATIAFAKN
ncbi:MAG: FtsQ-type POTRA domain-containing protein [Kofleriaceae bacterium]